MSRYGLFHIFWNWSRIVDRAQAIKKIPEKRKKTKRFGVFAVIYAILAALCSLSFLLIPYVGTGILLTIACVLVIAVLGVMGTLISLVTALIYWICQFSLNRRSFTWVTFFLMLACLATIPIVLVSVL